METNKPQRLREHREREQRILNFIGDGYTG
jgi:hypothetical protein